MALVVSSLPFLPSTVIRIPSAASSSGGRSRTTAFPRLGIRASSSFPPSPPPQTSGPVGGAESMDFPYASPPVRDLMVELVSTVEDRLGSQLLPCTLPPDVQRYQNQNGTSHASLLVRSGVPSSPIDFILGSWIHCELPTGAALNITSLSCYLNESTDSPNFLTELIQSGPTSLVLILDLPPRRDLVLHPDYLKTYYEDTKLDERRKLIENLQEVTPYLSTSLYLRSTVSPTAIFVRVETEAGGAERLQEIVRESVSAVARELLGIWLDVCASSKREVEVAETSTLKRRDQVFKRMTIEIDLGSSLPRLFGQETADRVLEALKGLFSG